MRKLAWFSGGFGLACLWACYGEIFPLFPAAAGLLLASLSVWLAVRPRPGDDPLLLRRPPRRDPLSRYALYQLSRRLLALTLGGVVALGWAGAYFALFRAPAEDWVGENVPLSGEVASYPVPTSTGGCSVALRLDGGWRAPDALAYGPEGWLELSPGDEISCTARRVVLSTRVRGDETTYYTAKGVYLLAYCSEAPAVKPAGRVPVRYWPALCARKLRAGIDTAFDETAAPIAAAVALGDKSGLDEALYSAFNRAGVMHAAVVSGLHISTLVAFVLAVAGRRRSAALAVIPFLMFFALMAGGTPSAVRAVVMQSALLLAPAARREEDGPTALGAALLVLLLQNPFAAASVGLQLSFASVAGILLVSRPLFEALRKPFRPLRPGRERRLRRALWEAGRWALLSVSASLGAMLFTAPLTALYFGQIPLLSPISSVLVLWALSLLMVCALVLGTMALVCPGLAALLGRMAGLPGRYARWMVLRLGRVPLASLGADNPYCLLFLAGAYLVLAAAFCGWSRPKRPLLSLLALAALLCGAIALNRLEVESVDLTVTALDVGQGSSTALLSGGCAALVDCGGDGSPGAGDVAADYFAAMGRTRLDMLVLTHFDADHFNGVAQLCRRMDISRFAIPSGVADPGEEALLRALAEEGAEVILVDEVRTLPLGDAVLTLYPPLGGGTSNESGLFALCTHGDFDVLITGDADAFVEKMMVKYYPIPDAELLIVGHHGARGSSCEEFLRAVSPELAVISVGAGNSYGHPAAETLARLEALGAEVRRTDLEGAVTVRVRGDAVGIY